MFRTGEAAVGNLLHIQADGTLDIVGFGQKVLGKFRGVAGGDADGILHYQHLTIGTITGTDADDPAESVLARAGAAELEQLVRALREPYGKIAVMYFLEHKENAEIARLVGRPPATVNSQLWRAKLLLRQQILERRQRE